MFLRAGRCIAIPAAILLCTCNCPAQELLTNGGFETGDMSGWNVFNLPGSDPSGTFAIGNNTPDPNLSPISPSTPVAELASVGSKSGSYYAVSDSKGPGTHVLLQSFNVPVSTKKLLLSFDMFVNDWNGAGALNDTGPLDHNQLDGQNNLIPTQFARVDLLKGGAAPFSTAAGDVMAELYLGEDPGLPANDYTHYQFNLTGLLLPGSAYELRFAEVDNQFTINQGVDNASLVASSVLRGASTPEPGTYAFFGSAGLAGVFAFRARRKARRNTNTTNLRGA